MHVSISRGDVSQTHKKYPHDTYFCQMLVTMAETQTCTKENSFREMFYIISEIVLKTYSPYM
jgi:hypothetical protein